MDYASAYTKTHQGRTLGELGTHETLPSKRVDPLALGPGKVVGYWRSLGAITCPVCPLWAKKSGHPSLTPSFCWWMYPFKSTRNLHLVFPYASQMMEVIWRGTPTVWSILFLWCAGVGFGNIRAQHTVICWHEVRMTIVGPTLFCGGVALAPYCLVERQKCNQQSLNFLEEDFAQNLVYSTGHIDRAAVNQVHGISPLCRASRFSSLPTPLVSGHLAMCGATSRIGGCCAHGGRQRMRCGCTPSWR